MIERNRPIYPYHRLAETAQTYTRVAVTSTQQLVIETLTVSERVFLEPTEALQLQAVLRELNPFFALDAVPTPPDPGVMALAETGRCHSCQRGEGGHWRDATGRVRCWDTPSGADDATELARAARAARALQVREEAHRRNGQA